MAIIGILATAGVFAYQSVLKDTRDARRKTDLKEIQIALENYKAVNGTYPLNTDDNNCGWDVSDVGTFINPLLTGGFLKKQPTDPKPGLSYLYCTTGAWGYRYYRYLGTESSSGCGKPHYIIGARMENSSNTDVSQVPDCYAQKTTFQDRFFFGIGDFE